MSLVFDVKADKVDHSCSCDPPKRLLVFGFIRVFLPDNLIKITLKKLE